MTSKQLARIKKMEDDFNLVREVIHTLDDALADYEAIQRRITRLTDYQESGQWLKDFEADERGELPKYLELKRGVLSEDGLDNLLRDVADVHARMLELVKEPDPLDEGLAPFVEYDPLVDSPESIPEAPGSLIFVLRYMSNIYQLAGMDLKEFEGQEVLFVGESENLRKRIAFDHFRGDSSRSSLRISFGCLLDMVQIPRDKTPDGVHFRFAKEDEQWLTQWMKDNLLVYYKATPYNGQLTKMLMTALNPPLNLENTSSDRQQFRKELIELRNNLRMQVEDLESSL